MLKFKSVNKGQVIVTDEAKEIRENEAIPADKFTILRLMCRSTTVSSVAHVRSGLAAVSGQ